MMRLSIARCSRQLARPTRAFSTSIRTMAEGDLGAPSGGRTDAFSKREKGQEDAYVRQQEMQKLHVLRQKLRDQKKAIEELEKDLTAMVGDHGSSGKQ